MEHRDAILGGHVVLCPPLRQRKPKRCSWSVASATPQPDATRLEEHGESEIRAGRLSREGSANSLHDRTKKEGCCRRLGATSRVISEK
jgi:hypothetical protein